MRLLGFSTAEELNAEIDRLKEIKWIFESLDYLEDGGLNLESVEFLKQAVARFQKSHLLSQKIERPLEKKIASQAQMAMARPCHGSLSLEEIQTEPSI